MTQPVIKLLRLLLLVFASTFIVGATWAQDEVQDQTQETPLEIPGVVEPAEADTEPATEPSGDPKALWKAAREGDLESLKSTIESGTDVDAATEYGATALFFACDRGHLDIAKFLLEKGANPNAKDTFYQATPITWAQMNSNKDIIVLLLENGSDGADDVLIGAVSEGDIEMVKAVLDADVVEEAGLIKARDSALRSEELENKEEILALFESRNLPEPVATPEFSPEELKKFEGKFKAENFTVTIEAVESALELGFDGGEKTALVPTSKTEFLLGNAVVRYEFEEKEETEEFKSLIMNFGGDDIELTPVDESEDANEMEEEEAESDQPKFAPSSTESRQADLAVSSFNWPGFRGNGARGVADGQYPPTQWHVNADNAEEESDEKEEPEDEVNGSDEAEEADANDDQDIEEQDNEEQDAEEPVRADSNLKWKTNVPGLGLSSPAIWGDRIFLTSTVPEGPGDNDELKTGLYGDVESVEDDRVHEFQVFCYSKTDGSLIWKKTANKKKPSVKRHAKSSHANPTVATDGEHVVAFFGSEGLYCYTNDGQLKWELDLGLLDSGWFYDPGYQWGFASSPIIYQNKVIIQCDIQGQSFVAAFDVANGEELWRTDREEIPSWSTPTVHNFGDLAMLITTGTKAARAYDVEDGSKIWSLKGHSEIVVPTPFVARNMIFVASGYSPVQPIFAIQPTARGDISLPEGSSTSESIAWSIQRGGPYMPTPIVYGDYLYSCANNGILTCYVATTGEQVYKKRIKVDGGPLAFSASPLASDRHLYLASEDGRVVVVKTGPEFEVVATNQCGDSILATPAISDGVVYIRTQNTLIAVGGM